MPARVPHEVLLSEVSISYSGQLFATGFPVELRATVAEMHAYPRTLRQSTDASLESARFGMLVFNLSYGRLISPSQASLGFGLRA